MAANDAQIKAMLADPEFAKLPHDQQDALLREAGADIPAPAPPEQSMSDRLQAMPIAQVVRGIGRGAMGQHAPADASELEKGWAAGVGAANLPINLLKAIAHPIDTATGMAQAGGGALKIALENLTGQQYQPDSASSQLAGWAQENPGEAIGTALGTAASFPLGEGMAAGIKTAGKVAGRGIRSGARSYAVSNATKALGFKDAAEAVGSVLPGETAVAGGPVQFLLDKGIFKLGGENNPEALLSRVMPIAKRAQAAKAALMEGPLGKENINPGDVVRSLEEQGAKAGRSEGGVKVRETMGKAAQRFQENQQKIAEAAGALEPPRPTLAPAPEFSPFGPESAGDVGEFAKPGAGPTSTPPPGPKAGTPPPSLKTTGKTPRMTRTAPKPDVVPYYGAPDEVLTAEPQYPPDFPAETTPAAVADTSLSPSQTPRPLSPEPTYAPAGPSRSYLPAREADKLRGEYDIGYKEARGANPLDASAGAGDQATANALRQLLNALSPKLAEANAAMHNTIPAEEALRRLIESRTAGLSGGGGAGTAGLAPTVASAPLSVAAPFHLTRAAVAGLSKAPAVRGQLAAMMYALSKMGTPAGDALLMRMLGQGVAATDEVGPAVANASTRSRGQQ